MKNSLDQGTVIYGIKSDKYPAFPCYGIIITARCDIAQNKIPKYHYLVAVDASSWFSSKHGYQLVYSKTIADKMKTVCDKATALELDGQTLLSTSTEQLEIILQDKKQQLSGDRKAIKKVDELYACIQKYTQVAQIESDDVHRKKAIKSNTKSAITYIKDIDSGKLHHYYFLPQTAYLDNGVKSKGLIVDLLEIRSLSLLDAKKIANPFSSGILYSDLPSFPDREELIQMEHSDKTLNQLAEYFRLKRSFWLETESDFVGVEGTIQSPWCEHLMQRFSNVFVRIGLENPSESDFKALIEGCYQEGLS